MSILSIDFETRSAADLRKTGAARYFEDPSADVLCAAWCVEDGPVQTWRIGEPCPPDILAHVTSGGRIAAWNATFEAWGWKYVLGPKHGWPIPDLSQWVDTMAQAAAMSIPQSLDGAAQALAMEQQKDKDGMRLIRKFSIPRKAKKGEVPGRLYWNDPKDHPDDFAAFVRYCAQDVEVERAIRKKLVPLSDYEQRVWELTLRMNDRGAHLDMALVDALQRIAEQAKARLDKEMTEVTGHAVTACSQVAALTRWLQTQGVDADKLNKNAIEDLLSSELPEQARRAVELRKEAAKTSTAKLATMAEWVGRDDRVRGVQLYHGASTGRWCLPAYTPVTVLRGEDVVDVPIVEVQRGDKVWDGTGWVSHEGVVFSGFREVMHYGGVVATPEHRVYVGPDIQMPLRDAAAQQRDLWVGQPPLRNLRGDYPEREKLCGANYHGAPQTLVLACKAGDEYRPATPSSGLDTEVRRGCVPAVRFVDPPEQTFRAGSRSLLDPHPESGVELVAGRRGRWRDRFDAILGRDGREPGETREVLEKPIRRLRSAAPIPPGSERGVGSTRAGVESGESSRGLLPVLSSDTDSEKGTGAPEERSALCQVRPVVDTFAPSWGSAEILQGQEVPAKPMGHARPDATEEEHLRCGDRAVGWSRWPGARGSSGETGSGTEERRSLERGKGAEARRDTQVLGGETRREATFDIVNAGPKNRFRAWGVIVSNSGRGPQFQNLSRGTGTVKDPDSAAADMLTGDARWIDLVYGKPLSAVSDMLRACITASPGNRLLAADYSSIEGRVTAWLAGEQWVLDAFTANDEGRGPGMYELTAAGIFNVPVEQIRKKDPRRQIGKTGELALNFAGGVSSFHAFAQVYNVDMETAYEPLRESTDSETWERAFESYDRWSPEGKLATDRMSRKAWIASEVTKVLWRAKRPNIVAAWAGLADAVAQAVRNPGTIATFGKISYIVRRGFLWSRLPSGRCLAYGAPRFDMWPTPWGDKNEVVTVLGVNSVTKRWERYALNPSILIENPVQAVARDLMAHGMLQAEEAGYPIVLTVHDEGVADVPMGHGSLAEFERLLCGLPDWAAGLPVVASGWEGLRYRKD